MKKLIVTGHGQYANGLKSSLELLAGPNQDFLFIDFPAEMTEAGLKGQMEEIIQSFSNDELLFICDILGGTPYKNAATLANENDRIEVVAGCNLGSILEAVFQKETMSLVDLANSLVDSSKKYTVKFEKIREVQPVHNADSFENGI
ncbi:PTS sugar transporter subunit IIA [Neobacillus novalis]|uniref:PTS sugar transporter subunit IIA n=1 Tax=Neobacillus novalis TaxID=220687 RepID=A0AA95SAM3_9BACI|nr:PTS sugar transporter subunit IIA [Neobacillus novalis]WHY85947.1 PTS sugar transporter subunit IIA [Neobacillus novalis]